MVITILPVEITGSVLFFIIKTTIFWKGKGMKATESEQKILQLLWEQGTMSTMQITEKLRCETNWTKHAVISFLKRMEAKNLVSYEEHGRSKYYSPLISKEEFAKEERTLY